MTEAQADQIIDYISGMLRPPDPIGTRAAWRVQLRSLDPDIASRAAINGVQYWEFFPSWPQFYGEYRSLRRNEHAPDPTMICPTCKGDRTVMVALRKPETTTWMEAHGLKADESQMIEEYAPCPDCNSGANTSFRRPDGFEVVCPDPALVRQWLSG